MALSSRRFDFLGIRLPVSPIRLGVFAVRIDDYGKVFGALPEQERQLQAFALLNVIEEVLNERYSGHAFEVRTGEYAGIVQFASDDDEDGFFALIQLVKEQINRLLKLEVTIGVGPAAERWEELPKAYGQAAHASEYKWYVGKNQIISMDGLIGPPAIPASEESEKSEPKEIAALLKGPDRDAVRLAAERALEGGEGTDAILRTRIAGAQLLAACVELREEAVRHLSLTHARPNRRFRIFDDDLRLPAVHSHDNGAGVTIASEPGRGTTVTLKIRLDA